MSQVEDYESVISSTTHRRDGLLKFLTTSHLDGNRCCCSLSTGLAEKTLLCFSLYQNVPLIVSARQSPNAISCLNGIRFIAMVCVILGHSYSSGVYGTSGRSKKVILMTHKLYMHSTLLFFFFIKRLKGKVPHTSICNI